MANRRHALVISSLGGAFAGGVSTGGNTAGATGAVSNQVIFVGSNNITLSQTTGPAGYATISIFGGAGAGAGYTAGMSNLGNTAGTSGAVQSQLVVVGSGNISLSQSINGQSATLSIAGPVVSNAIQAVGSATGSGTNVSRWAADDHVHEGVFSVGVSTGGNTSGNTSVGPGQLVIVGGNNITLSQATAAGKLMSVTISAGAQSIGSYINMKHQGAVQTGAMSNASLWVFPLQADQFPGRMTGNTLHLNVSASGAVTSSHSMTISFGLYTFAGSSTLSLLNSASTSWALAADANSQSTFYNGIRFISFHSSLFASSLTLSETNYWGAIWIRTSNTGPNMSWYGGQLGATNQRSGTMGVNPTTSTTQGWYPFHGNYSVSITTAMPQSIHLSDINHVVALGGYVPAIIIENYHSAF